MKDKNKVWTVEEIKALLTTNKRMVEKSIVELYHYQTEDEKLFKSSNYTNGMGFNSIDSDIMSSFAQWILSGKHLSFKQFAIAQRKIIKYAKQLTKIANMKGEE